MKKRMLLTMLLSFCLSVTLLFVGCGKDPVAKTDNQLSFTMASYAYGSTASQPVVTLQPLEGTIAYTYKGRGDTTYAESAERPVNAGTYTITGKVAETDQYKEVSHSVDFAITKSDLAGVVFPTVSNTLQYEQTLASATLTGGTGAGTFNWVDSTIVPSIINEGYDVIFTPTDANYNTMTQKVNVTVTKKRITEVEFPTVGAATYGPTLTLSALTLTGGAESGTFSWETPAYTPTVSEAAATGYKMKFIPKDSQNYDYSGVADYNSTTKRVERLVKFTLTKATAPTAIDFPESFELDYGNTLADCPLDTTQGGTFAWEDDTVQPENGLQYELTFTADKDNYDFSGYPTTGDGALDANGQITKMVSIKVNKIQANPEDGFIKACFIAADASIIDMVTGQVTLDNLTLPAGYHFVDSLLGTKVYPGFSGELKMVYNGDPDHYYDSDESVVKVYVERTGSIQAATTTGDNATIITDGIGNKSGLIPQEHTMVAPENVELASRFQANDTVRAYGTTVTGGTVINFIWQTNFLHNARGMYHNANVRFYIKNNSTVTVDEVNNSFKAANGGVGADGIKPGEIVVVELKAGDAGNNFHWGINGSPAFSMDGTGSFIGSTPKGLAFCMPWISWNNEAVEYDFEVTLVVEPAFEPVAEIGTAFEFDTTNLTFLSPITLRRDDGKFMEMHQTARAGGWNNYWIPLNTGKTMADFRAIADKYFTIRSYVYILQCDDPGSMGGSVVGHQLGFPKPGCMCYVETAKNGADWETYLLNPETHKSNSGFKYKGQYLLKDATGYYYMSDKTRVDVTEAQALTATVEMHATVAGSPFEAAVKYTWDITDTDPTAPQV